MVGLHDIIQVHSALVGWPSDVLSIEYLDDRLIGLCTICLYGYGHTIDSYMMVMVSQYTVCLIYLKILQQVQMVVGMAVYGSMDTVWYIF